MKGIPLPDRGEDFTADPVELFFDLAYVFAFGRLVSHILHHPTWTGFGEFVMLFALIWFPWSWFTWAANAVSGNDRRVRALFLLGAIASVPMAAAIESAFDDGGAPFAVSVAFIIVLVVGTMAVAVDEAETSHAQSTIQLGIASLPGIICIVVGGFVPGAGRVVLWLIGLAILIAGTVAAGRMEWVMRPGHFAERHGLIVIVALGEIIVAIGVPVVDVLGDGEGLSNETKLALIFAGLFVALMWWSYFDRASHAFEHRAEQLEDNPRSRFARDIYTYLHFPLVGGILLIAAALEEITLHPGDTLYGEFRLIMAAGLAAYFLAIVIGIIESYRILAFERLAALAVLCLVLLVSGSWDGLVILIVLDVILLAALVAEHIRIEGPPGRAAAATEEVSAAP